MPLTHYRPLWLRDLDLQLPSKNYRVWRSLERVPNVYFIYKVLKFNFLSHDLTLSLCLHAFKALVFRVHRKLFLGSTSQKLYNRYTKLWLLMDCLKQMGGLEEHLAVGGTTRSRKTLSCHLATWFGCHQICWSVVEMPSICTTWKAVWKQLSSVEHHRVSECWVALNITFSNRCQGQPNVNLLLVFVWNKKKETLRRISKPILFSNVTSIRMAPSQSRPFQSAV